MKSLTLQDKVAYFAKVRRANYVSSLRLEGFSVPAKGAGAPVAEVQKPKKANRTLE